MRARSLLYLPATAQRQLERVTERGADAIIVDLEDGVVLSRKDEARAAAARFVATAGTSLQVWVRVNHGALGLVDVAAVAGPGLTGVCLPKVGGPLEVDDVDAALTAAEHSAGLEPGSIELNPMIETAAGLEQLRGIARGPRVRMIQIGEADLAADLRLEPGSAGTELLSVRCAVVVASRAAGIEPPIAAVNTDFRDLDAFRADTEALRRLGFRGRACIHPAQVPIVHEVFTPSPHEVERARALLALFDAAVARGDGAMVDAEGRMLDEALVRSAREVVRAAGGN